ncbi:hypothetical protein ACCAA_10013 [Candidatus Accumulibacter aalborgensis]|uniref:Uncharacterized protein n=1 Tax=Candidatus Accumulibacter aalborgensis TaxID=1860102 RepID=A0A1A8XCX2_9PROT|nr:hypothetical protein ACCAA_10013 [Candidatus Accumulibacter aalborgensis]
MHLTIGVSRLVKYMRHITGFAIEAGLWARSACTLVSALRRAGTQRRGLRHGGRLGRQLSPEHAEVRTGIRWRCRAGRQLVQKARQTPYADWTMASANCGGQRHTYTIWWRGRRSGCN